MHQIGLHWRVCFGLLLHKADDDDVHRDHEREEQQQREQRTHQCAGVIEPVQQHRDEKSRPEISTPAGDVSLVMAAFCPRVKVAHEHRETHMRGNREQRARNRRCQTVTHDIADVFKRRKAKRDEHRVNDTVKAKIEVRVAPRAPEQKDKLRALFHHGDDEKRHHDCMRGRSFLQIQRKQIDPQRL